VRVGAKTKPQVNRQIPVYTWLVIVEDDEFLRVIIRNSITN